MAKKKKKQNPLHIFLREERNCCWMITFVWLISHSTLENRKMLLIIYTVIPNVVPAKYVSFLLRQSISSPKKN